MTIIRYGQIYSTFIIMHDSYYDHNHCSVLSYCFIMAFLNWKDSRVSTLFCPANAPSFYVFAGRGRKGVSGGPAILITIKSLVPVTHIGAFIGRRLSKGACAASPAPGTPQHQSFYHLLPLTATKTRTTAWKVLW